MTDENSTQTKICEVCAQPLLPGQEIAHTLDMTRIWHRQCGKPFDVRLWRDGYGFHGVQPAPAYDVTNLESLYRNT